MRAEGLFVGVERVEIGAKDMKAMHKAGREAEETEERGLWYTQV